MMQDINSCFQQDLFVSEWVSAFLMEFQDISDQSIVMFPFTITSTEDPI